MGNKQQQVQVYQPTPPGNYGEQVPVIRYAPPTIAGGNEPLPPKLWLVAFVIFAGILFLMLLILLVAAWAYDMDWRAMFGLWALLAFLALPWGFRTWMDYGSGDKAARDQIRSNEKIEMRAMGNQDRAHERTTVAWDAQQQRHHEYMMAQLDAEKVMTENRRLQRALEYANARGDEFHSELLPTDAFVPGRPDPVVPAVTEWVMGIYDEEGNPDPRVFHTNGWMKAKRPWKSVWAGEEWADEARYLLEEFVLEPDGTGHRLRPGFQDSHSAAVNLAQIRNSR